MLKLSSDNTGDRWTKDAFQPHFPHEDLKATVVVEGRSRSPQLFYPSLDLAAVSNSDVNLSPPSLLLVLPFERVKS